MSDVSFARFLGWHGNGRLLVALEEFRYNARNTMMFRRLCVQLVNSCHPGLGAKEMDKNEEYIESVEQRLLQKVGLQEPDISKLTRLTQIDNSFHH